jgi:hypothetical protein
MISLDVKNKGESRERQPVALRGHHCGLQWLRVLACGFEYWTLDLRELKCYLGMAVSCGTAT